MTGPLYGVVRWFLSLLPVDRSGRRVFDETLADWRKEGDRAKGLLARIVASLRGCVSVIRGVGLVAWREASRLRGTGVPVRFAFWLLLPQVAWYAVFAGVEPEVGVTVRLLSHVTTTAFLAPAALFVACAFSRSERQLPALAAGLVAACLAVPVLVLGVPTANRIVQEAYSARDILQMEGTTTRVPTDGLSSSRPIAAAQSLVRAVWPQVPISFHYDSPMFSSAERRSSIFPSGWRAFQWLSFFGAYIALCITLPWLAARMRQRGGPGFFVVGATVLWLMLYQPTWDAAVSFEWLFFWMFFGFGVPWIPVVVVLLSGLSLRPRRPLPIDAVPSESAW